MRGSLKLVLRIAITLLILGLLVWKLGGVAEIGGLILSIDPAYVVLTMLVITLDRALMTYKWARLLRSQGLNLPFFQGLRIYCSAMVWGLFLPATMGADAVRAYSTTRLGFKANQVIASIVIERTIGFLSALLLGMISLILLLASGSLDGRFQAVWWAGLVLLMAALALLLGSFNSAIYDFIHYRLLGRYQDHNLVRKLRQFHLAYLAYRQEKSSLAVFFGLTFFEQLLPILYAWLIARGMNIDASLLYLAGAVPLAILIARIPITLDGLGVYDAVFAMILSLAGVSPAESVAITMLGRILQLAAWMPWWAAHVIGNGTAQPPQSVVREEMVEEN